MEKDVTIFGRENTSFCYLSYIGTAVHSCRVFMVIYNNSTLSSPFYLGLAICLIRRIGRSSPGWAFP